MKQKNAHRAFLNIKPYLYNDLEYAIFDDYIELQKIKQALPDSIMSGSGSTYFMLENLKESKLNEDYRLYIFGEGDREQELKSLTDSLKMNEKVKFFGILDVSKEFWEMFLVVIQLGAVMAVVVLDFKKLWPFHKNIPERESNWKHFSQDERLAKMQKFTDKYIFIYDIISLSINFI